MIGAARRRTNHLRGDDPKNDERDRATGEPFAAAQAILPAIERLPLHPEFLRPFLSPRPLGHALQLVLSPLGAERGYRHQFDGSLGGGLFVPLRGARRGELLIASKKKKKKTDCERGPQGQGPKPTTATTRGTLSTYVGSSLPRPNAWL